MATPKSGEYAARPFKVEEMENLSKQLEKHN